MNKDKTSTECSDSSAISGVAAADLQIEEECNIHKMKWESDEKTV